MFTVRGAIELLQALIYTRDVEMQHIQEFEAANIANVGSYEIMAKRQAADRWSQGIEKLNRKISFIEKRLAYIARFLETTEWLNETERAIFLYRHVNRLEWSDISDRMGYSYYHLVHVHRTAIEKLKRHGVDTSIFMGIRSRKKQD